MASSITRRRLGKPRPNPSSMTLFWVRLRLMAFRSLRLSSITLASNSLRTGTAISAAAVGVGARRSETKSISVVSVSWPTADIRGTEQAAAARTTISSLKAIRSSREPPPRATIKRSGRGISPLPSKAAKPFIAELISTAAAAPCTTTGQRITRTGKR